MSDKLFLELVSPEKMLVSEPVDEVLAHGVEGEFGVLPGHSPFFTALKAGGFSYKVNGEVHKLFIRRGFFEVCDDKVVVLAEAPEVAKEIDISHAKEEINRLLAMIESFKGTEEDRSLELQKDIEFQLARIELAGEVAKGHHHHQE